MKKQGMNTYLFFRTISCIFDEAWSFAIPLYMFKLSATTGDMGLVVSAAAAGSLAGFLFFILLSHKFSAGAIALTSDLIQVVVMFGIASTFYTVGPPGIIQIATIDFLVTFLGTIWFASSDTLFSKIILTKDVQPTNKAFSFAVNTGPVFGPMMGSFLFILIGLPGVAILNGLSFLGQMVFLQKHAVHEKQELRSNGFISSLAGGLKFVALNPFLRTTMTLPIIVRLILIGFMPFIPFLIKNKGITDHTVGLIMALFGMGTLLGSITYRAMVNSNLAKVFVKDTTILISVTSALIIVTLNGYNPWLIGILNFIAGYFLSRYQIEIRSMRQLITPKHQMAYAVSAPGFIIRLFSPASGFFFSALINASLRLEQTVIIGILLTIISFLLAQLVSVIFSKNYEN